MKVNAKIRKRIYYSLLISLLIHIAFVIWSFFVKLIPPKAEVEKNPVHVHFTVSDHKSRGHEDQGVNTQSFRKTLQPLDPFAEVQSVQPATLSKDAMTQQIESRVPSAKESINPSAALNAEHLDARPLAQVMNKKVRRAVRENLVEVGDIPQPDFVSGSPNGTTADEVSKELGDASTQNAKLGPVVASQNGGSNEFELMKKSASNLHASRSAELGTNLTYELTKYQDPKIGKKYFKLLVKVRDATLNFAVIPKEIVFLVDASQSIGADRLAQTQNGIVYALNHLNPDDRFNITIFKDRLIALSPSSLPVSKENVKKAVDFIRSFKYGGRTDVFGTLQSTINLREKFTPSYRLLVTDGFPTKGVIDARQLINEISALNKGKVSIFAFGGGVDVSAYMLDFIAYKNRGWAQVVDRDYAMGKELSKMYERIRDPLLLNLRYHISGIDSAEIYPRTMPDFFKGSEFIIYGTYEKEANFFVQVLGDVLGKKKEFVVNASLAEATAGNKDIAHQWAFHKVYYLISQLKYNDNNEALIDQIDELCTQYGIITPYSKMFRKQPKPKEQVVVPAKPKTATPAAPAHQNFKGRSSK